MVEIKLEQNDENRLNKNNDQIKQPNNKRIILKKTGFSISAIKLFVNLIFSLIYWSFGILYLLRHIPLLKKPLENGFIPFLKSKEYRSFLIDSLILIVCYFILIMAIKLGVFRNY